LLRVNIGYKLLQQQPQTATTVSWCDRGQNNLNRTDNKWHCKTRKMPRTSDHVGM